MKLTRYSSALQIKLLNIFDQIKNNHILLTEVEIIIQYKLTDKNAQKHDFLIKTVKSFFI